MSENGDPKSNDSTSDDEKINIVEVEISDSNNLFLLTKYFNYWRRTCRKIIVICL